MSSIIEVDLWRQNVLDRIGDLENQVRNLAEHAISPQAATIVPEQWNWAEFSGWVTTGTALRDIEGKIILDPSVPMIEIGSGGYIESADFVSGSAGFQINGGTAEFNDVTVRGTMYATAGEIGGWGIAAAYIAKDTGTDNTSAGMAPSDYPFYAGATYANRASAPFRVTPAGAIAATSGAIGGWTLGAYTLTADAGAVGMNAEATGGTDIRFWAGNATPASAPFRVDEAGALVASSANITGTIDANAGHIGTLDIDGVVTVGASTPYIQLDGPNLRIQTSNFSSGSVGFRIDRYGDAEFNNISARGELHSSVFVADEVHADGGTVLILEASILAEEVTTV